jgi:hypothetical protein
MTMTHLLKMTLTTTLLAPLLLLTESQAQGRGRRGPPAQAYEACSGKKAGDPCSFECRRGHVEGTCQPRYDERLSCMPKDRGPRGPRGRR